MLSLQCSAVISCSKLTRETPEQCVKSVQNVKIQNIKIQTVKIPERR